MTNVIYPKQFAKPRKPVCPVSETLASFRLATLRSEKMAEELERLERELDAILRDNPRVMR